MPEQMNKIYKTKLSSGMVSPLFPHSAFMKRLFDFIFSFPLLSLFSYFNHLFMRLSVGVSSIRTALY